MRKKWEWWKKIRKKGILTVFAFLIQSNFAFPIQLQVGDGIGGLLWQGYGGVVAETAVARLRAKI